MIMKTLHKKVVQKWGVVAMAITALSLPTVAHAIDGLLPKEGVSLDELRTIVPDLEVIRNDRKIELEGSVPERCVMKDGKNLSNISYEYKDGKHLITVRLANECENNFKEVNGEPKVSLSSALNKPIMLKDESGPVRIKYLLAGAPRSQARLKDGESLLGELSGKEILIKGAAERQAEADAKKKADDKLAVEDLAKRIDSLCKKSDFVGISAALEAATDLLGDVSELLGSLSGAEQDNFKQKLNDAQAPADAKKVRDAYIDAAAEKDWDAAALDKAYIEKRFSLISKMVEDNKSDKEVTAALVDKEIVSWQRELRLLDRDSYKKSSKQFASAYGDLGVNEYNAGKSGKDLARLENSERMYQKGMEFATNKVEWEKQLSKVNNQAFKVCVDKNPTNMTSCESKFADKGKEYADQVKDSLSANAESEDGALAYAQFMQEYGSTYGDSSTQQGNYSQYIMGFGTYHPYAPTAIEQYKYQAAQTYQQTMQQKMMQGQGGGMMAQGKNSLF